MTRSGSTLHRMILRITALINERRWYKAMRDQRKAWKRYEQARVYACGCKALMVQSRRDLDARNGPRERPGGGLE